MELFSKKKSRLAYSERFKTQKWLILLSVLIGLFTVILLYTNKGLITIFQNFIYTSLVLFLGYIGISILIQIFLVIRWKIIISAHGQKIPFTKLWVYRTIGYSLNYFTPTAHVGGEPIRALMLKRYDMPFPKGISTVLIDKSMEMGMNSFFAVTGSLILLLTTIHNKFIFFIVSLLLFLVVTAYYLMIKKGVFLNIFFDKIKELKYLKNYVKELKTIRDNIYNFYHKHTFEFNISVIISAILWLLMFAEFKVALLMLGYDAGLYELFLIITVVGLAYLIPIPAALGVLEISQASIFNFLKIDVGKAYALSFLIRSRDVTIGIIGMMFLFYKSFKFKTLFENKRNFFKLKL